MKRGKKPATTEGTEKKRENTEIKSAGSSKHSVSSVVARNTQLEDSLRRTLADYHNLERRIEDERRELSKLSSLLLVEKLLPILDNLENAQAHLKDQGLQIVIKQFKDLLTSQRVEEIVAENAQFNPHFHEAVETVSGKEDNKIVKVVNKGYMVENKVIRPAKVVVERKNVDRQENTQSADQIPDQVENDAIRGEV